MIRTTRGARRLVAPLIAVLLAGVVGLVCAASTTRTDTGRETSTFSDGDNAGQHRAIPAVVPAAEHQATIDLTSTGPERFLLLLSAFFTTVVVACAASRDGARPAVPHGRAPPRG